MTIDGFVKNHEIGQWCGTEFCEKSWQKIRQGEKSAGRNPGYSTRSEYGKMTMTSVLLILRNLVLAMRLPLSIL